MTDQNTPETPETGPLADLWPTLAERERERLTARILAAGLAPQSEGERERLTARVQAYQAAALARHRAIGRKP